MDNMNEEVKKAAEVLIKGGIILYPTDTIWGIGCDATNEEAVRRIYELKRRSDSKSMLVLLDSEVKLNYYVEQVPDLAFDLIEMSEKPLTIIYDKARNVAPNLIAEDGSLGIRITKEEFSKTLCFRFRKALVSTSANISGQPSPANFADISEEIKSGVDYIVGIRQNEGGGAKPSSIIQLKTDGQIKVIRE
jgi:L-threonylcarbamoyladenylate synthase